MKQKNKKILLVFVRTILVCAGLIVFLLSFGSSESTGPEPATVIEGSDGQKVVLAPATEAEKAETERYKENLANSQNNASDGSAKPVITYAVVSNDRVDVDSYVPGLVEDGGKCTAILNQGDRTETVTTTSVANTSTTTCPTMSIKTIELGPGVWDIRVEYISNSRTGISDIKRVYIP